MTEYNKINDDVLLIDDFLSPQELKKVKDELTFHKDDIVVDPFIDHKYSVYLRMFIDKVYEGRRTDSDILSIVGSKMFSEETYKITRELDSYSFQSFPHTSSNETQVTSYMNGGHYKWHQDLGHARTISYVLPINMHEKKWTDGELKLNYRPHSGAKVEDIITIVPKENQLIMFSSHVLHKVEHVKLKSEDVFDGRLSINGHVGHEKNDNLAYGS
jgi:Rps23 Pro-64 3,4-dihydroxylase Tpa1-like proline 4-hydroxylase|tara:strand:- start:593 stop:1237 length:645 start_codon:yes stop_codon:yes gene_type:complete